MRHVLVLALSILSTSAVLASPETIRPGQRIEAELTSEDSPREGGGVSRDYKIEVDAGSFLIVSASSEEFDGLLSIFNPDRSKAGDNDDRTDGSLDPLVAVEASQSGVYTIRIASIGEGGESLGKFSLRTAVVKE